MTSFKTPARGRWARDNASGAVQGVIAPGAMAINWPDRKVYVGGPNGNPILFSQWYDDFNPALTYKQGDYVFYEGNLLRATADQPPSAAPSNGWEIVLGETRGFVYDAAITGPVQGGIVTLQSGTNDINISSGSGFIVDNTKVEIPDVKQVDWGSFSMSLTDPGEQWTAIGIDALGQGLAVPLSSVTGPAWRRENIFLAVALWSGSMISSIIDLSVPSAQTAENLRDVYFANGGSFRSTGLRLSPGDSVFSLEFSAGTVFSMGVEWRTDTKNPNLIDVDAIPEATLTLATRGQLEASDVLVVDGGNYDAGGSLTPIPADQWTIQYVTATPDFSTIYVQYGQTLYASVFGAAEALPEDYENFEFFAGREVLVLCGAIIVGPNDNGLSGSRVINALNDPNPFVGSVAQETGDFLLLDGSRPMVGPLNMGDQDIEQAGDVEAESITGATIQCRSLVWA